jgi:hypothetical protein
VAAINREYIRDVLRSVIGSGIADDAPPSRNS